MTSVIIWMTGALVSFMASAVAVREISASLNIFEIGIVRTGGGLIILVLAILAMPRLRKRLDPASLPAHIPRNLAHALGGMVWTLAITLLPLATVFSLEFTAPAWAAILAFVILGERVSQRAMLGIAVNLIGVIIILRPSLTSFDLVSLLPLGAAFCFALSVVLTRRLALQDGVFPILFWMMVIQLPLYAAGWLAIPLVPSTSNLSHGLTGQFCVVLAVAGLCSQLCLSQALRVADTVQVVTLDFFRIPLIALIGWSFYNEPADVWVLVGSLVIVLGIRVGLVAPRTAISKASGSGA